MQISRPQKSTYMLIFNILISPALPVFPNSYMLDSCQNRQKNMQFDKGGAKSDTPFDTLNREKCVFARDGVG